MGPSGSGKSTLMNILGCLDRPTSGKYFLENQDVSELTADQRAEIRSSKFGFVFQGFNLLRRTSAIENVMIPLLYARRSIPDEEARNRAVQLLSRVGLADRMHHEPSQLSGGEQQRVAIARALANHPAVLFADEPTGNLDSRTGQEILAMIEELNAEEGLTILLVTHDPHVASHARRIIRISDGRIVRDSSPELPVADVKILGQPLRSSLLRSTSIGGTHSSGVKDTEA